MSIPTPSLNSKFPVEIIASYSGTSAVESKLEIRSGKRLVYQENGFNFQPKKIQ